MTAQQLCASAIPFPVLRVTVSMTNVFHTYHPAVAFVLASALGAVYGVSASRVYGLVARGCPCVLCVCRGGRATLLSLRWIVLLCLVVAAANPFFVASAQPGAVPSIGSAPSYAEASFCTACARAACSRRCSVVRVVFLLHGFLKTRSRCSKTPRLSLLMVSQVLRLVPQFVSRGVPSPTCKTA